MKYIDCECGQTLRAESFEELWTAVQGHIKDHHPDLVGKIGLDDVKDWAQEE